MEPKAVQAYKGYFITAYAREMMPKTFVGFCDISNERPSDQGAVNVLERVQSVGAYELEQRAVQAAEFQARQVIDQLKPNWDPFTAPGGLTSR
ncbi:hypothetical protein FN976_24250 [Caenimonas sedimenti]|uniref:Uncharacterized protein n=1 Tax=Caenimonas sedimenti TaxID=2596921 RepID=A0A562ZI95_9BURK|nr:hypothetical protein [Caenimonas sedimenti]TWO68056.1 hypothetical protein FN976_24250 [Caenimonas sedimenti]